jgi:hypothetical protein
MVESGSEKCSAVSVRPELALFPEQALVVADMKVARLIRSGSRRVEDRKVSPATPLDILACPRSVKNQGLITPTSL